MFNVYDFDTNVTSVSLHIPLGSNRLSIGCMYLSLTVLDIFAIYHEICSVVFTMLNYERASIVIDDFVAANGMLPSSKSSPSKVAMREYVFLPSRSIPNVFRTVGSLLSHHPIGFCFCEFLFKFLFKFLGQKITMQLKSIISCP